MDDLTFDFDLSAPGAKVEAPATIEAPVEVAPKLFDIVQFLAGRCDGARTWDGAGFNKLDAPWGHDLANKAEGEWTHRDEMRAYRYSVKYRRQLVEAGFNVSLIEAPKEPVYDPPELLLDMLPSGDFKLVYRHLPPAEFEAMRYAVSRLPGRYSDRTEEDGFFWRFKPDGTNAKALRDFVKLHPEFLVSDAAKQAFHDLVDRAELLVEMSRANTPSDKFSPVDERLWPHQNAGIEYVREALKDRIKADGRHGHGCMIADQMGTGKTATSLLSALDGGAFNRDSKKNGLLVIVPASVKHNWKREAEFWLGPHVPDLKVRVLDGTGMQPIDGDVVIVNYDVLRWSRNDPGDVNDLMFMLLMRDWYGVVIDECHYLKNEKALRSEAVSHLLTELEVPFLLMMSGSPILNRTDEFVSQLDLLGVLKHFGNRHNFERAYCGRGGDRKELNRKLREIPGYLARLKDHHAFTPDSMLVPLDRVPVWVLPTEMRLRGDAAEIKAQIERHGYEFIEGAMKLPAKIRTIDLMELDNRREYEFAMTQFREWLREQLREVDGGMEKFIKMMRAEVLIRIEKLRQLCVRGKMRAMKQWISDFLEESDEKLVVFVQHTWTEDQLMAHLKDYKPCLVTGGQASHVRDNEWMTFQNDPTRRVLIAKLQAGGVGINLTAASHAVMAELGWNPGNQDQGEDRLHRGGQTKQVTIHYHFAAGTIDQTISQLIDSKRSEVTAATHGGEAEENAMIGQMLEAILDAA
jgi:SWI/SNF-related matrix-associated actin-dependent regulator 1 of chromatin subfamily A